MKILNRIHPLRNHLLRLALAGPTARLALAALALATTPAQSALIPGGDFQMYKPGTGYTVTAAFANGSSYASGVGDGIDLSGGTVTYSDLTSSVAPNDMIPDVDLPGWVPFNSGNDLLNNGVGGSTGMNIFASWGGNGRIQTIGSLLTITAGQTITITTMVGGPDDGPIGGPLAFHLLADGVQLVPTSFVDPTLPNGGAFQMISRTYNAAVLAPHVGKPTTIVLGVENANALGNRVVFDDVSLTTSTPDTTPPTLTSFEDNKSGGPIVVNEPVAYTVTFSEPMSAATVDASDFANTSATATTINSVAPTANPAVFLVGVTPTEAGTLQLQVMLGATLTDLEGNLLDTDPAILDDTTIVVNDAPPAPTTIAVITSGNPTTYGQNVTFTATVNPVPSGGTVQFWDGESYLGTSVAVNTVTGQASVSTSTLGATTHDITADYSGNFQFEASTTAAPLPQVVGKAPLTVRASSFTRPPNAPDPSPLPSAIFGFVNGENLATSGVTGTPVLTTDAGLASPVGPYTITCTVGTLASDNYSFTPENGTLTIAVPVPTTLIFGGDFEMYKPGTLYYVPAAFTDGPSYASGVGNGITLSGGTVTYSDTSVGTTVDLPGWEPLKSGNDLLNNGVGGSTGLNIFASWGGNGRIQTTGSLFTVAAGQSVTITAMVGGPDDGPIGGPLAFHLLANGVQLVPTSSVNPTLPNGGAFQMISRTYSAAVLAPHIGALTKIVLGVEDTNTAANRVIFDDVMLETTSTPAGFTTWAAANAGGQTPGEDFDNDGVENGIEYFMGETGSSFTATPGLDGTNTVTWPMDPAYVGTYEVQTSPDLDTWTNVDPRPLPVAGNLSYLLPTGLGKQFVRLLVTPTLP